MPHDSKAMDIHVAAISCWNETYFAVEFGTILHKESETNSSYFFYTFDIFVKILLYCGSTVTVIFPSGSINNNPLSETMMTQLNDACKGQSALMG